MKKLKTISLSRNIKHFLVVFLGLLVVSVSAQTLTNKDVLLYSTDFTDWTALTYSSSSSNAFTLTTGAGAGFTVTQDASVNPTIGMYWIEGSTSGRQLITKAFDFLPGGAGGVLELEFELTGASSSRTYEVDNQAVSQIAITEVNLTGSYDLANLKVGSTAMGAGTTLTSPLNTWMSATTVQLPKNSTGRIKVAFYMPSLTGSQTIAFSQLRKDMPLRSLNVYASIGALKYVAATQYSECSKDGTGLSLNSSPGGTTVSDVINIKGWNLSGGATLALAGAGASSFNLPVTSITQADALASIDVPVEFTPSVRAGIKNAQVIISSPGATDYCVSLTGITGGTSPLIVTPATPIKIWTSQIASKSIALNVAGINLTSGVSLSLTGSGASRFSLSTSSVSLSDASSGLDVIVSFVGETTAPKETLAQLVLSSPGAADVTIPLTGVTLLEKPVLWPLTFEVDPEGTAYVDVDLVGPYYLEGTEVKVSVTLEANKKIASWSDAGGNTRTERTFTVSENKNGLIVVKTEDGTQDPNGGGSSGIDFYALAPTNVLDNSFDVSWSGLTGATSYKVKVYNENGVEIPSLEQTVTTTSVSVSGLLPGTLYRYSVETSVFDSATGVTTDYNTGVLGVYRTTGSSGTFVCGQ